MSHVRRSINRVRKGLVMSETQNVDKTPRRNPVVSVVMGSQTDWPTMVHAAAILEFFRIPHEILVCSAHRAPDVLKKHIESARRRGVRIVIAGAGGAAHLPGVCASWTALPVLGVPIETHALKGMDSLLSIVQMPAGIPVATFAIGDAGAKNAALFAVAILAAADDSLALFADLTEFRQQQAEKSGRHPDDKDNLLEEAIKKLV